MPLSLAIPPGMPLDYLLIGHCGGDNMRTYQKPAVRKATELMAVTAILKAISGDITKSG